MGVSYQLGSPPWGCPTMGVSYIGGVLPWGWGGGGRGPMGSPEPKPEGCFPLTLCVVKITRLNGLKRFSNKKDERCVDKGVVQGPAVLHWITPRDTPLP